MRLILDVGNWDASVCVNAPGQSGDPASPHYADQLQVYSQKQWPSLPFATEKIRSDPNYRTITLSE